MDRRQQLALAALWEALKGATECGLLDRLQSECASPDSVNDFCDAVTSAYRLPQPEECCRCRVRTGLCCSRHPYVVPLCADCACPECERLAVVDPDASGAIQ